MPLDFFDLDAFARGTPFEQLSKLRRECPVSWHTLPTSNGAHETGKDGFWLVTRHRDVVQIAKDATTYRSGGGTILEDSLPPPLPPEFMMVRDGFAHLDPPRHTIFRQLIAPLFSPHAMAKLEDRIRARASSVLDRAVERRNFELVQEVAEELPIRVVYGDVLGFPDSDLQRARIWGDLFIRAAGLHSGDREYFPLRRQAATTLYEVYTYARDAMHSRREGPREDVLSVLASAKTHDGGFVPEEMFLSYFWSLVTGAYDTTASTIAGGFLALSRFPNEHAKLLDDPSNVTTAVEEMLRWVTPVVYFRRTASAETEIAGQRIQKGQRVAMCYAAANRDEDEFANPDTFDICRRPNNHVAFGYGPHFCLGAALARIQIGILLQEVIRRRIDVQVDGEVIRARSNFINRIKTMNVTLTTP
jgi:cytochrome P450